MEHTVRKALKNIPIKDSLITITLSPCDRIESFTNMRGLQLVLLHPDHLTI